MTGKVFLEKCVSGVKATPEASKAAYEKYGNVAFVKSKSDAALPWARTEPKAAAEKCMAGAKKMARAEA